MEDVFAFLKPVVDAHTMGINFIGELLRECGYKVLIAPQNIAIAVGEIEYEANQRRVLDWLQANKVTKVGLSYRLDPAKAAQLMGYFVQGLKDRGLLAYQGGPLSALYFAGLPQACELIEKEHRGLVQTFHGGESPKETLQKLGVPQERIPAEITESSRYDDWRLEFGREVARLGAYQRFQPVETPCYPQFGTKEDTLEKRLAFTSNDSFRPLMRAHVGPYSFEMSREAAVQQFLSWVEKLVESGFLDILSIGTSQLTQSNFGENWEGKPNGGGVPINSIEEYEAVWARSRPLLVRTYAGTKNIPQLAAIHEESLNISWHALSLWWFNQLDGRGPYGLLENLRQHIEAINYIAQTKKPLEANVSHHFAFRGADDLTYIVSTYLAARLAKKMGIKTFVLQNMLNTPRFTWGIQDLAKSRALLKLIGRLAGPDFKVLLQPRAGLDYFRPNLEEAKAQLASVTALMDDIDPHNEASPPIIHVVSYSEGLYLATPTVVDESIRITHYTLEKYRELRKKGNIEDMSKNSAVKERTLKLVAGAQEIIAAIEEHIDNPYSAEGLYKIFVAGFLPTPYLWSDADEFQYAKRWKTKPFRGGVSVVDELGNLVKPAVRIDYAVGKIKEAQYFLAQQK